MLDDDDSDIPMPPARGPWDYRSDDLVDWSPTTRDHIPSPPDSPTPIPAKTLLAQLPPTSPEALAALVSMPSISISTSQVSTADSVIGVPAPVMQEDLERERVLRSLLAELGVPAPTDDQTGHELYNLRAKAFIGCALVDLNDPTFLAQAAWSVYGTPGEPDQNDVAVMASDFKKVGRRHWVFPLDAAIDRSWLKDGSMATDISGLVTLPTIQLNIQAMPQSRVLFFNGNKRRRACRLYAKYFDIRLQKVDAALEQLQRDPSTASPAVIQTLEARKSTLRHAATRSGLWVTRLYDIWKVSPELAKELSDNHEPKWCTMSLNYRVFTSLSRTQEHLELWIAAHPQKAAPDVGSPAWADHIALPSIHADESERDRNAFEKLLTSPAAVAFLRAFAVYPYYRFSERPGLWKVVCDNLNQVYGFMWAHAVLDGLQRMNFCARTTSFVSFEDREETNKVLRNFLKVKSAGGLPDDPGREQDIKARYRSYMMEAQEGGEHVSAIWEHRLLEKIDTLYRDCFLTEKPPPPIGTPAWNACMRSYNRSLISVCDNTWTLSRHAGLSAAEVQASSYALNKLRWMQRIAHDGFAINLPLPTVSFLRQHAYLFSDISVAVRWLARLLDPRADAVVYDNDRHYRDFTHYLVVLLQGSGRFPESEVDAIPSELCNFVLSNLDLFKAVNEVVSTSDLTRADAILRQSASTLMRFGQQAIRPGHPEMISPLPDLYPEGCSPELTETISTTAMALLDVLPPLSGQSGRGDFDRINPELYVRHPVAFELISSDALAAHPCLRALRLTDTAWHHHVNRATPSRTRGLVFHLHSLFKIQTTWGRAIWLHPAPRQLRARFFDFLTTLSRPPLADPQAYRWQNWDDAILHLLADVDIRDISQPLDSDSQPQSAIAAPEQPLQPLGPVDEQPLEHAQAEVYRREMEGLVVHVGHMTSTLAAPGAPQELDSRVANALNALLEAIDFNANRIVYREAHPESTGRPWVMPRPALTSVPQAHVLAIDGVADRRAYRTVEEYAARDPDSFALFDRAVCEHTSRNDQTGPQSHTVLRGGLAFPSAPDWLPQDSLLHRPEDVATCAEPTISLIAPDIAPPGSETAPQSAPSAAS
ncbi:hypothetical protein TRAPUB_11686 [Trametes pubescens]|uniref:Uncharacterized protein n=1 Tax=Trametes pubescens TaxID=154538 RepID=A0A1M2VW23_TRAPU|nr:hypothetical protein TRAPUB_11686 [Trametes pubescens]